MSGRRKPFLPSAAATLALCALAACGGGGGSGGGSAPLSISYPTPAASYRAGSPAAANVPTHTGGSPTAWSVAPALPAGLVLDAGSGAVSGTPSAATATGSHLVTGLNALGQAQTTITVQVTPALPPEVASLAAGFAIEKVAGSLAFPAKFAFAPAPDGRIWFNELKTGQVRILEGSAPKATPFATLPVLVDAEQGLLGIAFPADFSTTGHVYVFASTPAEDGHADRSRIVRFTNAADVGTDMTVVVDDLPTAAAHTAGALEVGPDDRLYASIGDVLNGNLPQENGSRAGRVLRYARDGTVPAGNPIAGDPEWVRGLRNSYDLAFHPTTGVLFASENGPTNDDEVNHLIAGRNYAWPFMISGTPGPRIAHWFEVIAPTGIAWCTGGSFGPEFEDNLFVLGYVSSDVRRLVLSGVLHTDLDAEIPFLAFVDAGGVNKPLDGTMGPDGALYVSTPNAIWRAWKYP